MSAEWYREKDASWARTRQDFPQSAYPGPFKTRMLEIDAWAKVNNPDLHYNSSKPYLIARMVQDEIDAETARQRQASRQVPATSSSHSVNEDSPSSGVSSRGRLTGSALGTIWIGSILIVSVVFGVAYLAYRILRPMSDLQTAVALGRTWLAWTVAITTIGMIPTYFRFHYTKSVILWFFAILLFGTTAFLVGWIIGLIKYKGVNRAVTGAADPPIRSEEFHTNKRENHEFFNNLPERQFHSEEHEINPASPLMKTNEYEVIIPEGKDLGNGYVEMIHLRQYSLLLKNHRHVRCDAAVVIDGINVGTWRINSCGEIRIERPVHDNGHFTFFEVGTPEARAAAIGKDDKNGLISVTFTPEVELEGLQAAPLLDEAGHRAGATGLTGQSKQRFVDAELIEHDSAREFTIHIRLVSARPDIRPLAPRSTPVPPPVD
jgi:hypothetical protein